MPFWAEIHIWVALILLGSLSIFALIFGWPFVEKQPSAMSTLVNRSGDDEFYSGSSLCSADFSHFLSLGYADVYCPPGKRPRLPNPLVEENSKKASMEMLPDECLFEILRRLGGGRERSAAAVVSKRWLMLLSSVRSSEICESKRQAICLDGDCEIECDGYLTRTVEGKRGSDVRLAAIAIGTSSRGGLGKLSVRGSKSMCGITNAGLLAIARGCPSLRALSLWDVPCVGDEGLMEIAKECHSLEKLDLCQCPWISSKGLVAIAERCPSLTWLTIESCSSIGNEGLQAIGRHCSLLQSVTIKDCPLVGDQGVATLLSSTSSAPTKVKLHGLKITDFSLAVIGHYGKAITSLALSALQNVSQKGFWVMGNAGGLKTLASLTISSCRGTTDVSLEAVGKGCPNLKLMCLAKCCFVSDHGLVAFSKAAGGLESLQVEECNRITQIGVVNAISNCGKLRSVSVVKCMNVMDLNPETELLSPCESLRSLSIRNCPGFGLAMVGKLCPQLYQLDLSGLCGITDAPLLSLLETSKAGLAKVNLSGCLNLSDEVAFALARLHGQTLEVLNLDGCRKMTDASLVAVANSCTFLNDLDVSKCSITDSGVAALSRGVQINLQILSLSGCSMVSSKSVPSLGELGKNLLGLNLQQCNGMSSSAIELLVEHLWRCDILS
ncbi:PREDICTED: EIN3-binding F-box protein 1-like [Ipomoea nil]|uniref:EIN3-binding F-box protein 1-like n=1 Tax=Ipomoea nil TaxID=35883 RepID=UPI00090163A2|nr:PREDICTED: EIN3-binding F-box protein 1-like [Ipomoea nil]